MISKPADRPRIERIGPREHREAFAMLCSRLAERDRSQQVETFLTSIAARRISADGLLGAYRGTRMVGVVFSQVEPGRTGLVWPPRLATREAQSTAISLLETTSEWLAAQQVVMAQVQLPLDPHTDDPVLLATGYEPLADLLYLVCLEGEFPTKEPQGPLEYEAYCEQNHRRLLRAVEATYEQTLDCPRLNGVRATEDVLAGYRATGVFDPHRWLLVRHGSEDVGCLLLSDHVEHGNFELVYMGVLPWARGHGWGAHITRHAQWLTRREGRARLVLAVDAANEPALRVYVAAGFRAWDRRSVYLRVFRP